MKLNDIIALAKQGYKPSDIKELLNMADTTETNSPVVDSLTGKTFAPTSDGDASSENKSLSPNTISTDTKPVISSPTVPVGDNKDDKADEVDYKKLYEETQDKLKKAQEANRATNLDKETEKDVDDLLVEMFGQYM